MLVGREPGVPVTGQRLVLLREVDAASLDTFLATLGEGARALGQAGLDDRLGVHPVAEGVLAVLDDGLAGVVAVVCLAGLTGGHGSVVDQVQKVLAVSSDDGDLLAVLAQSVELVLEGGLDLFAGDVGQLSLSDEGLGLGANQLLLQNDNSGRVGVLVLQLGDLIGDLLLACALIAISGSSAAGLASVYLRSRLGCTEASMFRMLLMVTRYWS